MAAWAWPTGSAATPSCSPSGFPPAIGSASVHAAEVITTGISGLAHFKLGNVRKDLFLRLLIPGIIGGGIGAYALTRFDGSVIKPYISGYLVLMGVVILIKGLRKDPVHHEVKRGIEPLALAGGLLDALGGGGWGPMVTTTLVASGNHPRQTIGSVNASEFFVTRDRIGRLHPDHRFDPLADHPGSAAGRGASPPRWPPCSPAACPSGC